MKEKEFEILYTTNRINTLEQRGRENQAVVRKLKRKLRRLQKED